MPGAPSAWWTLGFGREFRIRIDACIGRVKQRRVYDPDVIRDRHVAIDEFLEQVVTRLTGEWPPKSLDGERMVDSGSQDAFGVRTWGELPPPLGVDVVSLDIAFVQALGALRPGLTRFAAAQIAPAFASTRPSSVWTVSSRSNFRANRPHFPGVEPGAGPIHFVEDRGVDRRGGPWFLCLSHR